MTVIIEASYTLEYRRGVLYRVYPIQDESGVDGLLWLPDQDEVLGEEWTIVGEVAHAAPTE